MVHFETFEAARKKNVSQQCQKGVPAFKEVAECRFGMFRLNLSTGYFYYVALSLDAVYTSHVVYSVSRNGALWVCDLTCSRLYNLRTVSASGRVYTEVVVALRTTQQGFIRHGTSWRVRAEYGWKLSGLLRRFLNSFSVFVCVF